MSVSLSIGTTPNYATVCVGALRLGFSYRTVIAFSGPDDSAVRVNSWGPTTGKHLNAVDGGSKEAKAARIPSDEFEARLEAQLKKLGL
ncbi:MAG: hypothetical protein Tp182DCM212571_14 [Prokaryotic dsDNA virus sp.]|jgi:hypothetical protein|nr:MAG: hypothetical protein Tp182DCM212571_14 [Prokaryotic dsDNA virus sp.]|tara:strand:- start:6179 stop:6442 length:264 start_codon:yes stop_codon:yes gene_type:complete